MLTNIKTKLTPIRYPGGKSNALKFLDKYLPKDFKEYREPFFGGGSLGLYLMQFNKDANYWINDLFYPVYCFWKILYNDPESMVNFLQMEKAKYVVKNEVVKKGNPSQSANNGKELHAICKSKIEKSIQEKNEFDTACLWYILNKLSYSGMAMIGSYAPLAWDQNFTDNCIVNLPKTSNLMHSVKSVEITNHNYSELLERDGEKVFIFMDPPYDIKDNLYGTNGNIHREFDHLIFYDEVAKCKHKWMITYNNNEVIVDRFKEYNLEPWELQYTMKAAKRTVDGSLQSENKIISDINKTGKKGKELLIWN
jgi:DNA adenine methylase